MTPGHSATATRHLRTLFALGAAGSLTDAELLDRFATHGGQAGELAFALLVERHGPTVLRVARCHLPDEASSHDAFQATFLILARKARSLRVANSLGPWLREVARRVASQARRAQARRRFHERAAARAEAAPARDPGLPDLLRAIGQEVERLPSPYRLAVVACHLDGLTQHEAADRLGWKLGTLQSRLDRGRRRLRDALRRRGLAPSLAPLALKFDAVPPALAASTAKAAGALQGGKTAAGVIAPAVLVMIEATTKGMLMTKLKCGALALMMLGGVVGSGVGLGVGRPARATDEAGQVKTGQRAQGDIPPSSKPDVGVIFEEIDLDGDGKPEVVRRDRAELMPPGGPALTPAPEPGEPPLRDAIIPRPWETAVRVKLPVPGQATRFASGTIIESGREMTIILTGAHNFERGQFFVEGGKFKYRGEVVVNLTDGKLGNRNPASTRCLDGDWPARVIAGDYDQDLLLLEIRPGRVLPASPIATGPPARGANLIAVGCSNGGDPTAWSTRVIKPLVRLTKFPAPLLSAIQCAHEPKPGRSGGGLFDAGGALVGVCLHANPQDHTGLYARTDVIHKLLERNGLARLVQGEEKADPADIDWSMVEKTPKAEPAPGAVADPRTESTRRPATVRDLALDEGPLLVPLPEPEPARLRPSTDQDRRIDDLERKLDRILKALESPKAVPPDAPGKPTQRQ